MMARSVFNTATVQELPVFEPNDYFWEHHWDESKQEKWEVYAETIRKIIAEQGGFKLTNNCMEDKFKYREMIAESYKKAK